jgi:hypothetical protein
VSAGGGRTAIHHKGFHPHGDGEPQRSLNAHADLDFVSMNRVFETPALGGQLAVGLTSAVGYNSAGVTTLEQRRQ